jgi:hypothetical protein
MKTFAYDGPVTSATIGGEDVIFHPDAQLTLDETNAYVKTLVQRGRLTEVQRFQPQSLEFDAAPETVSTGIKKAR